jgi:hypothetical protein
MEITAFQKLDPFPSSDKGREPPVILNPKE